MFDINLAEAEQIAYLLEIRLVNESLVNQITFLFLCFLSQDVTVVSMMSLDLTCTGETESLLRTGIRFYFWHCFLLFNCYYIAAATHIPGVTHLFLLKSLSIEHYDYSCIEVTVSSRCLLLIPKNLYPLSSCSVSFLRASSLILALAKRPPLAGISASTSSVFAASDCLACSRASASRRSRSIFC